MGHACKPAGTGTGDDAVGVEGVRIRDAGGGDIHRAADGAVRTGDGVQIEDAGAARPGDVGAARSLPVSFHVHARNDLRVAAAAQDDVAAAEVEGRAVRELAVVLRAVIQSQRAAIDCGGTCVEVRTGEGDAAFTDHLETAGTGDRRCKGQRGACRRPHAGIRILRPDPAVGVVDGHVDEGFQTAAAGGVRGREGEMVE